MKFESPSQNNSDQKTEADEGGISFSGSDDAETSPSWYLKSSLIVKFY